MDVVNDSNGNIKFPNPDDIEITVKEKTAPRYSVEGHKLFSINEFGEKTLRTSVGSGVLEVTTIVGELPEDFHDKYKNYKIDKETGEITEKTKAK